MSQKLTFTTPCVYNTTISNAIDVIYYDIQTPEWEPHSTTVRRLDPHTRMYELAGEIRSEPSKPAMVSLYGGEFEPEHQWIKKVEGSKPAERQWHFKDSKENMFAWSITNKQLLDLHNVDKGAKKDHPLATFYQHKRHLMVGTISQQAYLEVDNATVESLDAIIVSLLIVERKRRAGTLV